MSLVFFKVLASEASRWGRRQDALHPLKVFCGGLSAVALVFASQSQGWAQVMFFAFALILVLFYAFCYLYLLVKDPSRLQSEEFLLKDRALDLIESKGGRLQISEEGIRGIANPYADHRGPRELESGEGGSSR